MRTLQLVLSASVITAWWLSPAIAQKPVAPESPKIGNAEKKELEEKLQQLLKQLQELEGKKVADAQKLAEEAKKLAEGAKKAAEARKGQLGAVKPALPAQPGFFVRPPAWQALPGQPGSDPTRSALEALTKSSDPKVAALAKELLAALPKPAAPANPFNYKLFLQSGNVIPPLFELKPGDKPNIWELKPGDPKFTRPPAGGVAPRILVPGQPITPFAPAAPATSASSLKLSADGKTAAVIGADGTVTIYDVATGKEQMKFPGKK